VTARLPLALLLGAALVAPPVSAEPTGTGAKPLIVAEEEARSEFLPGSGAAFAVTVAPAPGQKLVACVVRLSIDGRQLPATRLFADIEPAGAAGPTTLVLRDSRPGPPPPPPTSPARTSGKGALVRPPTVCPATQAAPPPLLEQGAYAATVRVAQEDGSRPTDLHLSFDKKPATVKADATLAMTRVVWLLCGLQSVTGVSIQETSGRSPLHLLDATPSTKIVGGSTPLDLILSPPKGTASPRVVEPGEAALFDVQVRGGSRPGKAVGLLALHAPELAGGVVMLPVEVTTRLSYFWLGLLLVLGLALGVYMRDVLEQRRKLDAARARAYAALKPLEQLLSNLDDAVDVASLTEARTPLQTAMDAKDRTPESIDTAVEAFKAAFKAAVEKMAERRAKAAEALAKWSAALGLRGLPVDVQALLDALADQSEEARADLGARAPAKAEALATRLDATFANELFPAARLWVTAMRGAKGDLPSWPEAPKTEDPLQRLGTALDAAGAERADGTPEGYAKLLRQVAEAAQAARDELTGRRAPEIAGYAGALLADAEKRVATLATSERAAAWQALKDFTAATPATMEKDVDARTYMKAERALFDALVAFFGAAADTADDPDITAGKFRAALAKLGDGAMLGPNGGDGNEGRVESWAGASIASGEGLPQPQLRIRLRVPLLARVGQPASVSIVSPDGTEVTAANVSWTAGALRWTGGSRASFTPTQAGPLIIRATISAANGETSASAALDVLPVWDESAEARLFDSSRRILNAQTVFSTMLTFFVGLLLLAPGFVGTLDQLFLAFAWGFAADIGLDKVVDLAKTKSAPAEKALGTG
jgi:hypothetical protein